jgi:hypothetical protein
VFEFSGGIEKKEKCGQVNCDEDVDIIWKYNGPKKFLSLEFGGSQRRVNQTISQYGTNKGVELWFQRSYQMKVPWNYIYSYV